MKIVFAKILFIILLLQAAQGAVLLNIFEPYPPIKIGILATIYLILFPSTLNAFRSRSVQLIVVIYLAYFIVSSALVGAFSPLHLATIPMYVVIGYIIANELRNELLGFYVKVVYFLSIISLFFYAWLVIDHETLKHFMSNIGFIRSDGFTGIVVFNLKKYQVIRNSGFAWEPGPFSCFVSIALFFNIIRNDFKIKNKQNLVFLVTILTTQSTTGMILLGLLILFYLINLPSKSLNKAIYIIFFIIIGIWAVFKVPFLGDKIKDDYELANNLEKVKLIGKQDERINPGRFVTFKLNLQEIKKRPLFGFSSNDELSLFKREKLNLSGGGTAALISRYGLIMFGLWLFLIYHSSRSLSRNTVDYKFKSIWIVVLLTLSFSFTSIIQTAFIFTFYMLPFIEKSNIPKLDPKLIHQER